MGREAEEEFDRYDNRSSAVVVLAVGNGMNSDKEEEILQWNLCQRDDGNEYDNTYRKSPGIAICAEDVRRYFVTDFFPKHQETGDGHT